MSGDRVSTSCQDEVHGTKNWSPDSPHEVGAQFPLFLCPDNTLVANYVVIKVRAITR